MKHFFAIGQLEDGRWTVENLEQVELTKDDIQAIASILKSWLTIRE